MKIIFLVIGKTEEHFLKEGISIYEKRLRRYVSFELKEMNALRDNLNQEDQKRKEAELILKHSDVISADILILLDEKGKEFSSEGFSGYLQKQFNRGAKKIVFVVGGPFGFGREVRLKATDIISLSKLTFSHQMVRLFFIEQVYRAMTILKGEKYHH